MIEPGAVWSVAGGLVVAIIGALSAVGVRRTREATSMRDAWDRIDGLQHDVDSNRRALRITEEGMDALWSWSQRAIREWGQSDGPPAFTSDEKGAIARARRAVELSTGPQPIIEASRG